MESLHKLLVKNLEIIQFVMLLFINYVMQVHLLVILVQGIVMYFLLQFLSYNFHAK